MQARAIALRVITWFAFVAVPAVLAIGEPAAAQDRKPAADAKKPAADAKKPAAPPTKPAPAAKTAAAPSKAGPAAKEPPGHARKQVTPTQAVSVTREILVKHGFQVERVEVVDGAQVIYYRAGNQGRGRGHGPIQKMIVRPSGNVVTFEAAPDKVRLELKVQLGF